MFYFSTLFYSDQLTDDLHSWCYYFQGLTLIRTPQACYLSKSIPKNIPKPGELQQLLKLVSVDYVKISQHVSIAILNFR